MHKLFLLLMCPAYALTTDPNFSVTGCNDADNIPELTLRIQKQYFVDNLSWQSGFTLTDDDTAYEKKIPENQLLVDLSDQCKFLLDLDRDPVFGPAELSIILRSSEHTLKLSSYFSCTAELLSEYDSISAKTRNRSCRIR